MLVFFRFVHIFLHSIGCFFTVLLLYWADFSSLCCNPVGLVSLLLQLQSVFGKGQAFVGSSETHLRLLIPTKNTHFRSPIELYENKRMPKGRLCVCVYTCVGLCLPCSSD